MLIRQIEFKLPEGKPYIIFVKEFSASKSIKSCGGELQILHNANGDFNNCSFAEDIKSDCKVAFPENFDGAEGWDIDPNMALDSWVKVGFKAEFQIDKIEMRPKANNNNNIARMQVKTEKG